ncbi:MAG: ABC transporter substrate-binding protein [Betaproteobacteria bacterium]|nr:ABC transporter substrate-binding protein [Betaproteobacteria bacterium]
MSHVVVSRLCKVLVLGALLAIHAPAGAQQAKPIKIGFVTFLSGPAAGPFGVPTKVAAEAIVESLNAGSAPPPHNARGFGGAPVELVFIDEAGGPAKQVNEFRNLVERQGVDFVIGYIASGDCLAVAPVAEEMKKLTVLFSCGTPRVFEEAKYKYVFRTRPHATMDAVAAAMYLLEKHPGIKNYAGINQNYAWGQDSWNDFSSAMSVMRPQVEITTSQMPKFGAGQYGAEISALLASNSNVIHSSLWGGDLEAFMVQAGPRGLFKKSALVLVGGEPYLHRLGSAIPDGTIVGARGTHGVFAPDGPLNTWLKAIYNAKTKVEPNYPAYDAAAGILGLKTAYEAAKLKKLSSSIPMGENKGVKEEMAKAYNLGPSQEEIIAAFEGSTFQTPSGRMRMALGKGHQVISGTAYGTTKLVNGQVTVVNIRQYPAETVQPPDGIASLDWIKAGMKTKK